jgi:molecular chaperone Hsp33
MQLYQSVVPLEGVTTAEVLQRYMERSEQIETRFVLAADENRASGLLVQKMPALGGTAPTVDDPTLWDRVGARLDRITREDLLTRPLNEVMHLVLEADELQLFESMKARFRCRCSRDRVGGVIRMIGADEARSVIAEQGKISIRCEFCGEAYTFDAGETEVALAGPEGDTPEPADA